MPGFGQETHSLLKLIYGASLGQMHYVLSELKTYDGGHVLQYLLSLSHTPGALQATHYCFALTKGLVRGQTQVLFYA